VTPPAPVERPRIGRPIIYVLNFGAIAIGGRAQQGITFNYGGRILGVTGKALIGQQVSELWDVNIARADGDAITTGPLIASAFLGDGSRPYNLLGGNFWVAHRDSLTVDVGNLDTGTAMDQASIAFWLEAVAIPGTEIANA